MERFEQLHFAKTQVFLFLTTFILFLIYAILFEITKKGFSSKIKINFKIVKNHHENVEIYKFFKIMPKLMF